MITLTRVMLAYSHLLTISALGLWARRNTRLALCHVEIDSARKHLIGMALGIVFIFVMHKIIAIGFSTLAQKNSIYISKAFNNQCQLIMYRLHFWIRQAIWQPCLLRRTLQPLRSLYRKTFVGIQIRSTAIWHVHG